MRKLWHTQNNFPQTYRSWLLVHCHGLGCMHHRTVRCLQQHHPTVIVLPQRRSETDDRSTVPRLKEGKHRELFRFRAIVTSTDFAC